jgi:site-specific DNA-methyltransferase (cytosine-N4-specific)
MILNMERSQTHLTTTDRVREQMRLHLGLMDADGEDWDYAAADTKTHTHCYHIYPAMMIPQVARRLIRTYGAGARLLLDPFCGSGTSLVEARLAGLNAIGIDLNPFATLLARAKTTDYDLPSVYKQSRKLRHFVDDLLKRGMEVPAPRWLLRRQCARCSNTRRGEYKLYRIPEAELPAYRPRVFETFWERLGRNLRGLEEFLRDRDPHTHAHVYERDLREGVPLPTGAVDIVVTSPPYGDSQTTVAYGQFSRLVLQWLGYDDETAKSIDKRALGGRLAPTEARYESPSLARALAAIGDACPKRAAQVKQFYDDFAQEEETLWQGVGRASAKANSEGTWIC